VIENSVNPPRCLSAWYRHWQLAARGNQGHRFGRFHCVL